MGEKKVLLERHNKIAKKLKQEWEESLTKTLERGKKCKKVREESGYNEFKVWSIKTGYSISTLNRDINRYEFHELSETEIGKEIVKNMSVRLVSEINKLRMQDNEKFMELLGYIDKGLDIQGIKDFLEENIIIAMSQLDGEKVRGKLEQAVKEIVRIDIRKLKHSTGKKIMKAFDTVFRLISGCTKLNTEKNSRELSRKIEEINYGLGVVSIS